MSINTPRRQFGALSLLGGVGAAARLAGLASSMLPAGAAMAQVGSAPARDADPALVAEGLFAAGNATRLAAAAWFEARGSTDGVAALIRALRFNRSGASRDAILAALRRLTGANGQDWFEWVLWQQAHPEIRPFSGHDRFLSAYFSWLDPAFRIFIHEAMRHEIRLEEIVWGGVVKDGIPALVNPAFIGPEDGSYIRPDDLVFGVEVNGDARAYPLRILDWHEMFNDVVGGVPLALAYCTLCGSGILFETLVTGRQAPFDFGSSGLLYRSNKLMYDQATHSLWNQFTGRPVAGPLTGSGIELKVRPVAITSWREWRAAHPATRLLSLETGHRRNYAPGAAYSAYFASPDLMFPALTRDLRLDPKDYVFALRGSGVDRAWPLELFSGGRVINDAAGFINIVLVGNAATRTVRAYRRDALDFTAGRDTQHLRARGQDWRITEAALVAPDGRQLDRLPGHIAYWFAWAGYLGEQGELGGAPRRR